MITGRSSTFGSIQLLVLVPAFVALMILSILVDSAPHPHQGVVKPFPGGDPGVKLDERALNTLKSGQPYKTQIQAGTAGRGLVVQDVHAPVNVVWDRILDFNSYNKMVPKTAESVIYKEEQLGKGQKRIWVRMKVGFPVLKLEFFINHLHDPAKNSLTWTLDYSKKSDLDDSVGFWYVIPHPDNPEHWTRVYYSVEVSMFSWVPQFVVDFMSKQALIDATAWVKKQSELRAPQLPKAASGSKASSEVDARTTKKVGFFASLFGRNRISVADREIANKAVLEKTSSEVVTQSEKIGLTRYGLVASIIVLVLYNFHLYLSQ